MLTLFSQVLVSITIPVVIYRKGHGLQVIKFALFKLFPVLLTIAIMWGICLVLTLTDVFPEGHQARTDVRLKVLTDASWFRVPYPGQFGMPSVSLAGSSLSLKSYKKYIRLRSYLSVINIFTSLCKYLYLLNFFCTNQGQTRVELSSFFNLLSKIGVLGMLAGVLACTVESISYYPTVSRMCNAPPIRLSSINAGILIEGIGCVLAGLWGAGNGTNTFGENVGAIGVTKVGSRRVIQYAGLIMVIQGLIGKFCAVFIMIPDPVVGGIFCVMFGMITAFGLQALQYVNLRSSRNLYIIGVSLFFPLVLCQWMHANPGAINTGIETIDSTLNVLLSKYTLVFLIPDEYCINIFFRHQYFSRWLLRVLPRSRYPRFKERTRNNLLR